MATKTFGDQVRLASTKLRMTNYDAMKATFQAKVDEMNKELPGRYEVVYQSKKWLIRDRVTGKTYATPAEIEKAYKEALLQKSAKKVKNAVIGATIAIRHSDLVDDFIDYYGDLRLSEFLNL